MGATFDRKTKLIISSDRFKTLFEKIRKIRWKEIWLDIKVIERCK